MTPLPQNSQLRVATEYLAAFVAIAVATVARWLLDPALDNHLPYVTYFVAVAFVAWYAGRWPSIMTMIGGWLAADFFFVPPRGAFIWRSNDPVFLVGTVTYFMVAIATILLSEAMHVARRRAEAHQEALRVTLLSIGDAVIATDDAPRITFMNSTAETLTGWTAQEAKNESLDAVFKIVNEKTRQPVENPAIRALNEGVIVGLANHTLLIAKDGTERPIDDSAAPIRDEKGKLVGAVLVFRDIAERKESERSLQVSEARKRAIFEASLDSIITIDHEGRVIELNPAAESTFGYRRDDVVGRELAELIIPSSLRERHRRGLANYLATGEGPVLGRRIEMPALRADGSEILVELAITPIVVDDSRPMFTAYLRDITRSKEGERAQARLAAIVQSSEDAIISKNLDGVITTWNRGAERLFGYTAEEAVGQSVTMLIPDDHRDEEPKILSRIRSGESIDHYETVRRRKDGALLDISLTVSPIRDASGNIIGASKIARDISEQRTIQQAMHDSEVRYRRLFQAAKDGILILDANTGKITDANAFMEGLLGLEHDKIIGKELHEIGMFRDTEASKEAFRTLQREKYLRYEHLPMQNQRGEEVEVEVIANMYQEDHEVVAQCNFRDITDRVTMQKKMAEQAEQIASESRRKDEFLAMLSHEIRNPLAPIRSAVHLMRLQERGNENAVQQQAREIIERQVANLTRIVSDLLEVSRVISGRIRLDRQIVDLNQVISHAAQTAMPLIEQGRHKLVMNLCEDGGIWANADATRLEEVFVNLLNNAAKYTDEGGRIEVWCEHPHGENYVQIRIRDNGLGILPELLPRIFDLFTQADRTLDRAQGGLGIGLSLAHRLVEMHGGTIEAYSPPMDRPHERGSEFIVKLPVVPAPESAPVPAPFVEIPSLDGLRVLLVDDNIDMVLMLASTLRQKGYSVQSAYTGPEGLKVAQQWRPDIVLLDIGLPGLDGYEVARRIRSAPELDLQNARLIALTGYGRDVDKTLAIEAGFDAHITKPYEFDELQELMVADKETLRRRHK